MPTRVSHPVIADTPFGRGGFTAPHSLIGPTNGPPRARAEVSEALELEGEGRVFQYTAFSCGHRCHSSQTLWVPERFRAQFFLRVLLPSSATVMR